MRFVRLEVDAFQGIERAIVQFGPGLNVLHGRNDLGKSTIVRAIRAALLVPPSSNDSRAYVSWQATRSPRVCLVFQDDSDRYWKVDKTFAGGAHADLASSKDGVTFTNEAKAREVDEKLRNILAWGMPPLGGKGAPRKTSWSFLTRVLLADQSDVDELLAEGIDEEDDNERRGPNRLVTALAALAEDPVFKRVLHAARAEYDRYFTETGRKKTSQQSEFVKAGDEVKKRQEEVQQLEELVQRSEVTEAGLLKLRGQREDQEGDLQEASDVLKALEAQRTRQAERTRREEAHREAREALRAIDQRGEQVRAAEAQVTKLEKARAEAEATLQLAVSQLTSASTAMTEADKALAAARDQGDQQRERQRATLTIELAQLKSQQVELDHRRERVEQAAKAEAEVASARAALQQAEADLAFARRQETEATTKKAEAEAELAKTKALRSFGLLQQAVEAARAMKVATSEAEALHVKANEAEEQAIALDAERVLGLPGPAELKELGKLARERERAEAALGGGLSVQLRPKKSIDLSVTRDGQPASATQSAEPFSIEAQRSVLLQIGDLLSVEIQAGGPEQLKLARQARERWEKEAVPLLRSVGAADFEALEALCSAAADREAKSARLRQEAEAARTQAGERASQASGLARLADQATAREAALAGQDRAAIEKAFRKLGTAWETQVESQQAARERAHTAAGEAIHKVQVELGRLTSRVDEASRRVTQAAAALEQSEVTDAVAALDQLRAELEQLARTRTAKETELQAIDRDAAQALAGLQKKLNDATAAHAAADRAQKERAAHVQQARDALSSATGGRDQLRLEWAKVDRPAAEALVQSRAAALEAVPAEAPVTDEQLAAARRHRDDATSRLEEIKKELAKAEGVLEDSGGAVARERLQEVHEALQKAREAEEAVAVEADSWKLLKETLRDVENEEGKHLGRTLAGAVGQRFSEVTAGRYAGLALGPRLRAEGVDMSGANGPDVLGGLSVGTRDQLATLLRIAVAEEIRSAIVLDDHLTHSDPTRQEWFRAALRRASAEGQVIIVTCRPTDYADPAERAGLEFASSERVRFVNLEREIHSWPAAPVIGERAAG